MADVFALQGAASSGKSDTLIRLLEALEAKYPRAIKETLHHGKDVKVILRGVNGMVVGIESQGDPNSRLEESLEGFKKAKCDIIFCACRTRGMTVGWVNSLSPKYHIHFVAQTYTNSSRAASNAAMASSLMQMAGL